jgi:MFS family permease
MPVKKAAPKVTTVSSTEAPPVPGRLRRLIALVILSTYNQAVILAVVSFIPLFLVDQLGTNKGMAAASISLVYFMGLWAGPVGGFLADRWGKVKLLLALCFISGAIIYLLTLAPSGLGIGALLALLGIAIYFNTTAAQTYIVDQVSERFRATALGIYFFGNMEGSGILTPILGYLIDKFGFDLSFTFTGISLIAMLIIYALFLQFIRQ